ncbi:MAG TPA: 16S rRNA (uracil(1498)-N(3))-methyltransferase [Pirellulales bacterium]|nr:16S rRNA (uracil(1498)-N(3))-methyltransferase [Pirellulales bacterium]
MPDRFFCPPPLGLGEVRIDGPEAHHLLHVLRAKPGLAVVLFDGSGAEFDAVVDRTDRAAVYLNVSARRLVDREAAVSVTLGVAMPKGDRQRWLVEKATELGVARLVPLTTARGVAQPVGSALERFRRAVVEAAKQCGRNRLMEVAEPQPCADFCQSAPATAIRLIAHPRGTALRGALESAGGQCDNVCLAVGPEGGLTDAEVEQAMAAGWQAVDLGQRLLRTETAAIALAARVLLN